MDESATSNPLGKFKARLNPDSSPKRDRSSNAFGQFEQLTRKIVNVPKAEIDEKRKADS